MRRTFIPALALSASFAVSAHAATIWTTGASDVTFVKPTGADPALAANQDRISPNVWITRASISGLYNAKTETAFADISPANTQWAVSNLNNNPAFAYGSGAAQYASLHFSDWSIAYGDQSQLKLNITVENAVVHLLAEDVYFDLHFTNWGGAGSGAFTYTRAAAPVPEPASFAVVATGTLALLARRKRS